MFFLRFVLLMLTWCAFSGLFDLYHLLLGALASAWVAAVSTHIALSQPANHRPVSRLELAVGLAGYLVWLMGEIFKANLQVLKLSFATSVEKQISPQVVEFRTCLPDDFSRFMLAHSITLTPGTVTVRVDGDRFIVHALTKEMAAAVPGDMEQRLLKLFGGEAEVEQDPPKPIDTEEAAGDA